MRRFRWLSFSPGQAGVAGQAVRAHGAQVRTLLGWSRAAALALLLLRETKRAQAEPLQTSHLSPLRRSQHWPFWLGRAKEKGRSVGKAQKAAA